MIREDLIQLFCGESISRLDRVNIDLGRGIGVRVSEPRRDGCQRYTGIDHQGRVRMSEGMDRNMRQIVALDEIAEPPADGIGMDRIAESCCEQSVRLLPAITHL